MKLEGISQLSKYKPRWCKKNYCKVMDVKLCSRNKGLMHWRISIKKKKHFLSRVMLKIPTEALVYNVLLPSILQQKLNGPGLIWRDLTENVVELEKSGRNELIMWKSKVKDLYTDTDWGLLFNDKGIQILMRCINNPLLMLFELMIYNDNFLQVQQLFSPCKHVYKETRHLT